mgnify:CR=1 FL=1
MPQLPSEARPPTGPTSPASSNRSLAAAPTPALDSRAEHPVDPTAPRKLDLPNLMLLIADPKTGELLPEYQDEGEDLRLNLDPETLVPAWWPQEDGQGRQLLPRRRLQSFRWSLLQSVQALESWEASESASARPPKGSGSATPAVRSSRPRLVLRSLRQFRYELPPESIPTLD